MASSVNIPPAVPPAPAAPKKPKLRAEDVKKLREMLMGERVSLMEEIRRLDERSLADSGVDESGTQSPGHSLQLADNASDNVQVETDMNIRRNEDNLLRQIDDALRALEAGEYGVCRRCHEPISLDRLFARPNAKYCIPCLRLLESGKA